MFKYWMKFARSVLQRISVSRSVLTTLVMVAFFTYGSSSNNATPADLINNKLSRISSMSTNLLAPYSGTNIADFDWSGTGRRVRQSMGAGRIVRDSRANSNDVGFTNLDHFGRMKDFAFRGGVAGSSGFNTVLYRAQYGYDEVGNRTSSKISERIDNNVLTDNADSVESLYDALNRLTGTKTGTLDGTGHATGVLKHTDAWKLDLLGNWVGDANHPGRKSTRDIGNNAVETRSSTHAINERNELTFVDFAAENATNPPPPVDTTTIYDQSGNLVYDGLYFYQYDAWGRLIQVNQTTSLLEAPSSAPAPSPCPAGPFTIGAMIKHFTYDGLGRLVRVQSPWPDSDNASGGVRSERFYYDGARRIQELVTDPLATVELLETPEGAGNNPELGELLNQTIPGGTTGLDGSANPLGFESGQLNNPGPVIGSGGTPLPTSLTGLEREYIWGPGDNGLDEILVQYDSERKPFWMIQDGGGDVVAMCDLQGSWGSGGTARVVKSWQYDAYGQCLRATDVVASSSSYSIPINRVGHKGLFMDRLDKGLASSSTHADIPRLEPFSTVLYQNRNRTYSPQLGRFIQRDPNESGASSLIAGGIHGIGLSGEVDAFNLKASYRDSGSLHSYMRGSPWTGRDPSGLFTLPEQLINLAGQMAEEALDATMDIQGNYCQAMLGQLVGGYSAGQEEAFEKSDDWDVNDDELDGLTAGGGRIGPFPDIGFATGSEESAGLPMASGLSSGRRLRQLSLPTHLRGRFGERFLAKVFPGGRPNAFFRTTSGRVRFVDRVVTFGGTTFLLEVKTGGAKWSRFVQRQIDKDVELVDAGLGAVVAHWVFVTRGGPPPDPKLLQALSTAKIGYSIR